MDLEKRARRQSLRVIISELIMVLSVIVMVTVLAFVVSGYWINSDFKVERQGMLQIHSAPVGANVEVDGDSLWFQKTNTSKVLSSGEHNIVLTKDGYDSWSKTINIREGLLYKLDYPRLFLQDRKKEEVYDASIVNFASFSPNRRLLMLANNTTDWTLIDLDNDNPKSSTIDISKIFTSVSVADDTSLGLFTGEILSAEWDQSNEHILFKIKNDVGIEWVLLNVKNPTKSININREFAANFSEIKIFNNSASILLAVRDNNLHKIDVDALQISSILFEDIADYDFYDSEIIYVSENKIYLDKLGEEPIIVQEVSKDAKVLIGKFYDKKYIFIIDGNDISVYEKDNPSNKFEYYIDFVPEIAKVGYQGEFVFMSNGTNFATLDMELMAMKEWSVDSNHFGWIDNYMIYSIKDGELSVYDFDGLNRRTIISNASDRLPASITSDKWLYYFSDGKLMREWLISQ